MLLGATVDYASRGLRSGGLGLGPVLRGHVCSPSEYWFDADGEGTCEP
jgi:hypothetical protein